MTPAEFVGPRTANSPGTGATPLYSELVTWPEQWPLDLGTPQQRGYRSVPDQRPPKAQAATNTLCYGQ